MFPAINVPVTLQKGDGLWPAMVLRATLTRIGDYDDPDFHAFEIALVSHYRARPHDQEWIASELSRRTQLSRSSTESDRIEEVLAMLDHVHDPLISASALDA